MRVVLGPNLVTLDERMGGQIGNLFRVTEDGQQRMAAALPLPRPARPLACVGGGSSGAADEGEWEALHSA